MTYMDKLMKKKTFREKFDKEYEELCEALENGTPAEKIDAELEIMGRFYYYEGDWICL